MFNPIVTCPAKPLSITSKKPMTKRAAFGSDEWYEANKHLCHEWDTNNPEGGMYVHCLHCGDRATYSNGRNYCPSRRKS